MYILAALFYFVWAFVVYKWVDTEMYRYHNHSAYKDKFTKYQKYRLKVVLILGMIPGLQLLVLLYFVVTLIWNMIKGAVNAAKSVTGLYRKLNSN